MLAYHLIRDAPLPFVYFRARGKNMSCGIYKITNLSNGKSYIGQSINIERRWEQEKEASYNPNEESYNYPLSCAFRKYGFQNFSFEILEECFREDLNQKEQFWIEYYNSYKEGYNQTPGGDSTLHMCKLTPEQAEEIIELLLLATTNNLEIYFTDIGKKYNISRDTIQGINCGRYWYNSKYKDLYPLYISPFAKSLPNKYCAKCGVKISNHSTYCKKCSPSIQSSCKLSATELQKILFQNNGNFTQTAKILGIMPNTLRRWCIAQNISSSSKDYKTPIEKKQSNLTIQIEQYDKNNNYIQSFDSMRAGARWICENGYSQSTPSGVSFKISEACNGKRKTAYGYIWRKSNL